MSLDDIYFDESRKALPIPSLELPTPPDNPYEDWHGDEVNDAEMETDECARCRVLYVQSNIPGMVRCPACGEFVDLEIDEAEGAWEQSSRHKTRLDREDDDG